jgi:hypothetical protein
MDGEGEVVERMGICVAISMQRQNTQRDTNHRHSGDERTDIVPGRRLVRNLDDTCDVLDASLGRDERLPGSFEAGNSHEWLESRHAGDHEHGVEASPFCVTRRFVSMHPARSDSTHLFRSYPEGGPCRQLRLHADDALPAGLVLGMPVLRRQRHALLVRLTELGLASADKTHAGAPRSVQVCDGAADAGRGAEDKDALVVGGQLRAPTELVRDARNAQEQRERECEREDGGEPGAAGGRGHYGRRGGEAEGGEWVVGSADEVEDEHCTHVSASSLYLLLVPGSYSTVSQRTLTSVDLDSLTLCFISLLFAVTSAIWL